MAVLLQEVGSKQNRQAEELHHHAGGISVGATMFLIETPKQSLQP
jgi:hypothetical protein